jgi:hypothetical protein
MKPIDLLRGLCPSALNVTLTVGQVRELEQARIRREYAANGLRVVGGTLHQRRQSLISQIAAERQGEHPFGGGAA